MPFAGYEDFDACVRANSDKDDPEAYCAVIKRQIEGADGLTESDREAIQASDRYADALLQDDPCWENYTMVGTKTVNGQEVPNCVPDDDVPDANLAAADDRCGENAVRIGDRCVDLDMVTSDDAPVPPSAVASEDAHHLTLKSLSTEPIERVEEGANTVRYRNLKLLSPGIWADAGSQMETYYPPEGIANLQADYDESEHDGPPLNLMHDLDAEEWEHHEASVAGHVDPDTLDTDDDGNLFGDIVLDTSTGAGQFADENLQSTLEKGGTVGFGGPSVEIPADGLQQSHDPTRDMPRVDGGKLTGVALVMDPASKSVNFARESARRPVALADSQGSKVLTREQSSMSGRTLMDAEELREILDNYGFKDLDEMDDEDVLDVAADLHADLMDEMDMDGDGDDTEMATHDGMDDDEEEDDEDDMEMAEDMETVMDRVNNLASRLEDVEDALSQAMTSDEAQQELAAADTVEDLDRRLSQLEERGKEPKTLAENGRDEDFEPNYDTTPAQSDGW